MASVFVLLEAFNRKEAAALGFFPCATASFYLNQLRFKQNLNHVPIDCYIYNLSIFSLIHLMNKGVFVKCAEFVYLYN